MEKKLPILGAVKFCSDCSNFIARDEMVDGERNDAPRCRKQQFVDIVTGRKFFVPCHPLRYEDGAPCGMDAKLFEPKLIG